MQLHQASYLLLTSENRAVAPHTQTRACQYTHLRRIKFDGYRLGAFSGDVLSVAADDDKCRIVTSEREVHCTREDVAEDYFSLASGGDGKRPLCSSYGGGQAEITKGIVRNQLLGKFSVSIAFACHSTMEHQILR